jgi:signal transduction histidine kinase
MEEKVKAREKFNKYFTRNALYARYILDETTWKAINKVREELEEKKKELGKKEKILAKKEREIKLLMKEKKGLEEYLEKEKEKVEELELSNKEKQEQIYFLRGHVEASREYTHLLNLYHHVGISANTIEMTLLNLQTKVSKGNFTGETIREFMNNISKTNREISTLASIALKANINFDTNSLELSNENLTNFIIQYVDNVSKTFLKHYINIRLDQSQKHAGFVHDFNSIEIVMLFDNLFSNTRKAGAKTVTVEIISHSNELVIKVRDDGEGIPRENVDKIFDFGFSTTYGTGLGLFHVNEIVKELGGEITLNQEFSGGGEFIIKVKK